MVYVRISSEQGSKLWIDDPGNLRARMCLTNQRHCGQRVNDVAERAWLDDYNGFWNQVASFAEASAAREALTRFSVRTQVDPIFQSPVARRGAVANPPQQSSFAQLPDRILRETVGPGYSRYRKCSTLRASFHHAVGPHCPC